MSGSLKGLNNLLNTQNYNQAIADFSKAIYIDPVEPVYYWYRAEAYLCLADFESAILNFRQHRSLSNLKITKAQDSSYYVTRKRMAQACFTWGQCLLDQFRFNDALEQFNTAAELGMDPDIVALRIAIAKIGVNDLTSSMTYLFQLINNHCSDIDVYILRAKLYYQQENIFFCNLDLRDAVIINPLHPEIKSLQLCVLEYAVQFKNKASEQVLRKKFDLAIWYLNQAVELDPEDWSSQLLRGVLLGETQHYDAGIDDLMEVLGNESRCEVREEEIKKHISALHNKAAIQMFKEKNITMAIQRFTIALNFNPPDHIIKKNRAECYFLLHEYDCALTDLFSVSKEHPDDLDVKSRISSIYGLLGKRLLLQGKVEEAIRSLSEAIIYDPNQSSLYFDRAESYLYLQELDLMKSDLLSCIKLSGQHELAQSLLSLFSNHDEKASRQNLISKLEGKYKSNNHEWKQSNSPNELCTHSILIATKYLPRLRPHEGGPNYILSEGIRYRCEADQLIKVVPNYPIKGKTVKG
ncbi:Tetratricopeptide repeat protein 16 [Globomyces sp. JEL0801]|nr:Tetratricopeptide repeat protein 16 [Globomyces sp. JEL0801]